MFLKVTKIVGAVTLSAVVLSGCGVSGRSIKASTHYSMGAMLTISEASNRNAMEMSVLELNEAIRLNPKSPLAYYYRGIAHQNLGNFELARADFETVLKFIPDHLAAASRIKSLTPTELAFGESVTAEFTSSTDEHMYIVRVTENGRLTVETSDARNVDPYMTALNESGEVITEDDDGGEGYNAKITIAVEAGKAYTFKVRALSGALGGYSVSADFALARQGPHQPVALTLNERHTDFFENAEDIHTYTVKSDVGGELTVETFGSIDTYMEIYDESGEKIGEDDDGGSGVNARFTLTAEADKTYTFKIKELNGNLGEYQVVARLRRLSPPVALTFDAEVTANFDDGDVHIYTVTSRRAGWAVVETSGNLDTYLTVFDADGNRLGTDDDGGQNYNARYVQELEAGKVYSFHIHELNGNSGEYSVKATYHSTEPTPSARRSGCGSCGGC